MTRLKHFAREKYKYNHPPERMYPASSLKYMPTERLQLKLRRGTMSRSGLKTERPVFILPFREECFPVCAAAAHLA